MTLQQLLDRINNDHYAIDAPSSVSGEIAVARDMGYRLGWNHGSDHVRDYFLRWINEGRMGAALDELAVSASFDVTDGEVEEVLR